MGSTSFRKQIFSPSSSLLQSKRNSPSQNLKDGISSCIHADWKTSHYFFIAAGSGTSANTRAAPPGDSKEQDQSPSLESRAGLLCATALLAVHRTKYCLLTQNNACLLPAQSLVHNGSFKESKTRNCWLLLLQGLFFFFFLPNDHDQMVVNPKGCPRTTNLSSNSKVIAQAIAPKCLRAESWCFPCTDGNRVGWCGLQGLWSLPKWSRWMDRENSLMDG